MSRAASLLRLVPFPLAALLLAAVPSVASAQQSLQLDGVNDYVTFGTAPSLGATTFTIEVAFKRTGTGATASTGTGGVTAVPLITKGRGEADGANTDMNWFLGINAANQLTADYEEGAGQTSPGLNHPVTGTTVVTNNVWHHAAAVFDGTTWSLYLDGNLDATLVVGAGRLPRFDSIQHAAIGSALTSTGGAAGFFAGLLDEARVWNVARTQAQIQAAMGSEVLASTGLVGRWGLNEGTGTGAGNSVASGVNGTLTNGPVWSSDSSVPLSIATGVRLGSSNAYVALGNPGSLQLSAFTIELWIRRDGAGVGTNTGTGGIPDAIPLVAKGRAEAETATQDIDYLFGIRASDGVLCGDFEEGAGGASPSLNHPVAGVTPITTGVWHHVAATYDGSTWKLYLDGALEASLAVGRPLASASISPVAIGSALTSVGAAAGFFDGAVDEVRIWNLARTQAEIAASANAEITGATTGLVGRWGMNEDQGTVVGSTAGTPLNGTLTGAAWSWSAGSPFNAVPPAAPADPSNLTAVAASASQIDLAWTDNASNETGYEVERSTTGAGGPFTPLVSLPANSVSYSNTALDAATEYCYRVRATNGIGPSGYAAAACATTQSVPPPADPSGLTATAVTPVQVDLAWTDNASNETGYEVERSTTGAGGPFTPLVSLPANSVSYSNTALDAATEYCYRVRAVNGPLASGYAAPACATTLPAPAAPTGFAATAVTSGQIHLAWTDNATDESGYAVERSTSGPGGPFTVAATLAANAIAYEDLNRDAGAEYCYRVRALGAYVPSAYASVSCATTPAATPGSLDLAGATYVTFGDPNALDLAAFTLECWFRRDGAGTTTTTGSGGIAAAIPLVTHGAPEADNSNVDMNYFMGLRSDGVLCADFEEGAGGPSPGLNHPVVGTTPVAAGSGWHHAAATYDGSTWNLYLDGNLEATLAVGRPVRSNSIQRAALGSALTSTGAANGFFDGAIDEARVWSVARTQVEIQASANAQLSTPLAALVARWSLDEGTGTIVNSSAGTEVPGTITGANYSWSGPAPFSLSFTTPGAPSGLAATAPTHALVVLTWNDNSNNESSFQIERSTAGSGGPFAPLATVPANTTSYSDGGLDPSTEYCYRVRAVNGNGASAYEGPACATTPASMNTGLDFGNGGYASFGNAPALQLSAFTIEMWLRRDGAGAGTNTGTGGIPDLIPLFAKGRAEAETATQDINYVVGIRASDGVLCGDFEEGAAGASPSLNHPIAGATPIGIGTWHHVAATYDGATWKLYLDGNLDASLTVGQPLASGSTVAASLASALLSTGVAAGFFDGAVDEVRVWNIARTQEQIQATANVQIETATAGLVGRWSLNEGWGTTFAGSAGTSVAGTLAGSPYTWDGGAPFDLALNHAPDPPVAASPANGATGVSTSPTLSANVSDPDGDAIQVAFYGRAESGTPGADFTIIGVPDTQYYTGELNGGTNAIFQSQTNWIVANKATRNIVYVATLGDCVEHGDNGGNSIEWQRADASYSLIENPATTGLLHGIPYGVTVGNHDQSPIGNPDGTTTFYNQYFGESRFTGRSYYGGHYGSNNDNWYDLFSAGGMNFVVISLEYDPTPDPAILTWAGNLLTTYADRKAIVLSHFISNTGNPAGFGPQGQAIYDALKSHANLTLMLCGHVPGEGRRQDTFAGNTVHTLMSDYQGRTNGGNGWLRIYEFSPANNTLRVKTYSPWLDQYEADADSSSQFTLTYPMTTTPAFALIGTAGSVLSGGTATVTWPGLAAGASYEWYATANDGAATAVGTVSRFTTAAAPTYTLTTAAAPAGGGTITRNPDQPSYTSGASVELTATPSAGYHFVDWAGDLTGAANPGTLTMDANRSVTANFALDTFTITASAGAGGSIDPSGDVTVTYGLDQTFTIAPGAGYHVSDVLVDGASVGAVAAYTFAGVHANHTIAAVFEINSFTITASAGPGGGIDPSGDVGVSNGSDRVFTITPATGYHIADVLVDGVSVGAVPSYTFSAIASDHTIAASFALDTFTIAASAGPGGSIDPSGDVAVGYGLDRAFTIIPNPGYHVADVLVDGASVGPVTSYAFPAVTADHSIAATFAINTYTITATAGANGSIAPAGATIRNYGEDQAYGITPDPGYHVLDLLVDGVSVGALTSYTFAAVSADHTIAATFEANFDALDFAGTDGYANFGNPAALQLSTFTIEMWMRRDGTGAGTNTGTGGIADLVPLLAKGRAEAEDPLKDINYIFGFRSSTGVLAADFEEAAAPSPNPSLNHPVFGTTPLAIGTWYHVAATYDGSSWRLYLNGALDAELAVGRATATASNVAVSLGSALNSANVAAGFFDGRVDEVRVWNTARTATQLASTIDARLTTPVPGLVARWGLDEGSGVTFQSSAGTPLDGALTGAGWAWSAGAPFDVPTYTVTASAGAGGTIDPAGAVPVIPGSTPSFTIAPDACHDIADVLVDGASVGAVASYTFPPVSASAHTIAASFSLKSFAITASAGANGSISPSGATLVGCGADQAYVVAPDPGYHVADVLVDGVSVGAVVSYTFTGVNAAHTIAATFAQNGDALALAGTDGYVLFGNPPVLKLSAFTIEMWLRRDGAGVGTNTGSGGIADLVPLLSKGRADTEDPLRDINYILGVSASTGVLGADFEEAAAPSPNPSLNHPVLGTTPLAVGTWYHVAATYDGITWRLYVNGNLDGQLAVGRAVASASDAPVALGTAMTTAVPAAGFFQGVCDEVRVWSVARTPAEITATINDRLTSPAAGLVARWSLDEGAGTLVQSTAGTPLDGTVTGTGWSWTTGAPFNAGPPTPPAAPSNLTAEGISAGRIDLTWTDGSDNETGFEIERSTSGSGGPFAPLITVGADITAYSNTGLSPATEYCYRIRAVNAAGASAYDGPACTTTEAAPSFALAFNGSTYVSFGDPAALDLPQFTIETWFRRDGAGTTASTGSGGVTDAIPLVTHGTSQADGSNVDMNFFLGIKSAGAVLCADFEEGAGGATPGLNHPILGVTPIVNGVWYHAAATYDGATWKLYLNGNLESQLAVGRPVQSASIQFAALASSITSTGTAQGFFVGALDEARIWNAARSQVEIQGTINAQISSPATGLVARWALDEGSGTAVNGSAGTSVNGTISGTAYTWVAGAPFDLAFNLPPGAPALVGPADQATGVSLSPTLQVSAVDPDGQPLTFNFYGRSAVASSGADFTIVGMPDTQYYTGELNGGTNAILLSQTNWITTNRASRNIGYVATLGDCAEHGDNGGNDIEWQHADAGYSLIENPLTTGLPEGLPYGITVGNHDQSPNGNPDGATTVFYNQYFGVNRFTGRSYYGGHYGTNNDNWYNLFSAGGMDFVVISLEYDTTPDATILTWADGLLTTYANRRAIILSHNFIGTGNPGTFSAQGQATYDALKGHSNLFLMLCGHVPGEGRRSDTFNGNTVYTVMSDYQARTNGGNGWLRIMQFSPANNVIHVSTYSPWLDQTENDADSQFDIPYSMSSAESYALLGTVSGVASGGTASLAWPGLFGGSPYQWYATVSDGVATTTGPTWGFTTQTVPTHTLAVNATPVEGGGVTRTPDRAAYDEGSSVQLAAVPASGWEFRSWCGDASGTTTPMTVGMSRDKQVMAVFNEVGAPTVAVSAPNGGEALAIGSLYEIRWTASDAEGVELVDVLLSRNGPSGPFEVLGQVENTGSFLWTVSYPGTANAYVKVVAHNPAALSPSLSGFDLSDASFTIPSLVTGVDDQPVTAFSLRMTSGNPTSSGASLAFELPRSERVRVELFDAAGRLVATLADAEYPMGRHAVAWKGRTSRGEAPSGVYFVRFRAPGHSITRRFVLIR